MLQRFAADVRRGGWTDAEIVEALAFPEGFLQHVRDDVSRVSAARAARAAGSRRRP